MPGTPLAIDQRGVLRPQFLVCDIGAFEFESAAAAPVATDDAFTILKNTVLGGNVIADDNGFGPDSDDNSDPMVISSHTEPLTGTLALELDGSLVYIPALEYFGTLTFTYAISDGLFISNNATVTITVLAEDDGVAAAVEDGAPNGGDGNNDGIADSEQDNVASLPGNEGKLHHPGGFQKARGSKM